MAHLWARWLRNPCCFGDPLRFRAGVQIRSGRYITPATSGIPSVTERGARSEVAHLWARWLRNPCRLRDPHRFKAGGKIRSGPLVGKVATQPLPPRGSAPLQSGGQNQKWPTCGQGGYATPAVSGIPSATERGAKSEVAHLWARWLRNPCSFGDALRFRAGVMIRSGRYITPAASGIPSASEQGATSKVAHLWARWLRNPCRLRDPHRFKAGGKIRSGPLVGKVATQPLPPRGSAPLQSGGQNQKWPTYGQGGYATPAVSGIPSATERGAKSEVAHLWARWLRNPCSFGDALRFRAGVMIRSGRYITPAASGIPSASEQGAKSEVAHLWARWLRNPCRLGNPLCYRAGGKIRSGPLVGKVAT